MVGLVFILPCSNHICLKEGILNISEEKEESGREIGGRVQETIFGAKAFRAG